MQRIRVDAKWRVTIPEEYRKKLGLSKGGEVAIIPREDYLLMTRISESEDFKSASKRLVSLKPGTRSIFSAP